MPLNDGRVRTALVIGHPTMSIPGCLATGYRTAITASEAALIRPASRRCRRLRLGETETDRRAGAAFRPVGGTAARTEYRHQGLVRLAAHRSIRLNGADARSITLVALVTLVAFCTLFSGAPCGPCGPVPRPALERLECPGCLGALRSCRTLRARIALRSRIPATSGERKRDAHDEYRKILMRSPCIGPTVDAEHPGYLGITRRILCLQTRAGSRAGGATESLSRRCLAAGTFGVLTARQVVRHHVNQDGGQTEQHADQNIGNGGCAASRAAALPVSYRLLTGAQRSVCQHGGSRRLGALDRLGALWINRCTLPGIKPARFPTRHLDGGAVWLAHLMAASRCPRHARFDPSGNQRRRRQGRRRRRPLDAIGDQTGDIDLAIGVVGIAAAIAAEQGRADA